MYKTLILTLDVFGLFHQECGLLDEKKDMEGEALFLLVHSLSGWCFVNRFVRWSLALAAIMLVAMFAVVGYIAKTSFDKLHQYVKPQLQSYTPSTLSVSLKRPFFMLKDKVFYHCAEGRLTNCKQGRWAGLIAKASVAPNGQYIAVMTPRTPLEASSWWILDKSGRPIHRPGIMKTGGASSDTQHHAFSSQVVWFPSSDRLLLLRKKSLAEKGGFFGFFDVFVFDVKKRSLRKLFRLPGGADWFTVSKDGSSLLARYNDVRRGLVFGVFSLANGKMLKQTSSYIAAGRWVREAFLWPFSMRGFGGHSFDYRKRVGLIEQSKYKGNIHYAKGLPSHLRQPLALELRSLHSVKTLIRGTYGWYPAQRKKIPFVLKSHFLPGNRYILTQIFSQQAMGTFVMDTSSGTYQMLAKQARLFFHVDVKMRSPRQLKQKYPLKVLATSTQPVR